MMKFMTQIFTAMHVFFYRLTGGKFGAKMGTANVLLLDSVGRKSGQARTNPVMYVRDGKSYVVAASAGGGPANPGWCHNFRTASQTTFRYWIKKYPSPLKSLDPKNGINYGLSWLWSSHNSKAMKPARHAQSPS